MRSQALMMGGSLFVRHDIIVAGSARVKVALTGRLDSALTARHQRVRQRGFVAGRRLALVFFAGVRFLLVAARFAGAFFVSADAAGRDATRVECRVR
jgi:hypothetical protein